MAKKKSRFLLWQKATVGAIAVIAVAVFGYLYTLVLSEAPLGEFEAGDHYLVIEDPRRVRGDKVEVMEFFSYACIHCYNFEDGLTDWVDENRAEVNFVRTPAIASTAWRLLGRTYLTLEEMDLLDGHHDAIFRAIHEGGARLDSKQRIIDFLVDRGIDEATFTSMFDSSLIERRMELSDQMARRLRVASVPTIIVNGKYLVRTTASVGPTRMLDVMDHLVAMESEPASGNPSPSD